MNRKEIVTAFRDVLDGSKLAHKVDTAIRPGSIVIRLGLKCGGRIGLVWGLFEFKGTGIRIYGVAPGLGEAKNFPELSKLLAMVNRGMAAGCFEFEAASYQIRFRHFADCTGFAEVPAGFVCDTLLLPFEMFARHGDSFVALEEGFPDASLAFGMARTDGGFDAPGCTPADTGEPVMDKDAIFAAVMRYLEAVGAECEVVTTPDGYTLSCPASGTGSPLKAVPQTFEIWGTHLAVSAHCPVQAAPGHVAETAKFLALANYDLIPGRFDLDLATGKVCYRHCVDCAGFAELPIETLSRFCPIPCLMLRQYGDAIAAVATGRSDAESALAQAKKKGM